MGDAARERRLGVVRGVVQGVGFRPFVARLAREESLGGSVLNAGGEVRVDAEGARDALERFARRLAVEAPPAARIDEVRWDVAEPTGRHGFTIEASLGEAPNALPVPPDLATCRECLEEVRDPERGRFEYPFTNCTQCGPRYTIVESLPYDRPNTTMVGFTMCTSCRREYEDPSDRRHHAQPIACPECGPTLRLVDRAGQTVARRAGALTGAAAAIRRGEIVALKGLGGYQLLCDATDPAAVAKLRARKRRPDQPFAVMVASLEAARAVAYIGAVEAKALTSAAGPVVLLDKRDSTIAAGVAPRLGRLGVMLPTTPLHHLLLARVGPVVCTSGNVHQEPIAVDDADAMERLSAIADVFVVHDRPIARRVDDGVVHVVGGRSRVLRLGRGLGPISIPLEGRGPARLCVGGHLKNAPALWWNGRVVMWPHVGDLDEARSRTAFVRAIDEMRALLNADVGEVVLDAHPDYATSAWAEEGGLPTRRVHHHAAHVAACLAEHGRTEALGFAWDGYGMGEDGGAWGGEVFDVRPGRFERVMHLRTFPLPGGDAAARDGRRALAGLLTEMSWELPASCAELGPLARSARLSPPTSSVGRLFDAVAALTGVCVTSTYEGQAAMELEALAEPGAEPYTFRLTDAVLDFEPMIASMLEDPEPVKVASRFHATLAAAIGSIAERRGARVVALSGGCFQNVRLVEGTVEGLAERGIEVLLPERVPPNDGGLALGQAWLAARAG